MNNCLSDLSIPELSPSRLLSRSDIYLCAALTSSSRALSKPRDASHAAFLDTSVGPATLVLLRTLGGNPRANPSSNDSPNTHRIISDAWPTSLEVLRSAIDQAVSSRSIPSDENGSEVLYGRAGLLYAVLRLRSSVDLNSSAALNSEQISVISALQPLISDAVVGQLIECIIRQGKNGSAAYAVEIGSAAVDSESVSPVPPLMWSWHGKRYLGGAHGAAGILQMLLMCPGEIVSTHLPIILGTVEWLLGCQNTQGNWPTKAPGRHVSTPHSKHHSRLVTSTSSDELVQ